MNDWNFAITHSINKSYSFLNRTFESSQLKITSQLINKKSDSKVLPFTLTIKYSAGDENIEDSVFTILPGLDKPITTIIYVPITGYPYRITIDNPNKVVTLKLQTLKIKRKTMPIHQPQDNSALIAAINAQTQAVVAAQAPEVLDTLTAVYPNLGVVAVTAENDSTRGLSITTGSPGTYRIFVGDDLIQPPLFSDPNCRVELYGANAVYELASGYDSNVWVACESGSGSVSVTRTFVKPDETILVG